MKLKDILSGVEIVSIVGKNDKNIKKITQNSKKTCKNSLFFCIDGTKTSGILYLEQAILNGATAVVLSAKYVKQISDWLLKKEYGANNNNVANYKKVTFIFVEDVRKSMATISSNFYGNPDKKLKIIGITGTNGKTSTSYILSSMLKCFNEKVGVIGTNGIFIDNKKYEASLTTPDSIELFKIFAKMVNAKVEYCIMEVSAHAIYLNKIYGIKFFSKILTNIDSDHLDFFKTQKKYVSAKAKFFEDETFSIINIDDKFSKKIAKNHKNCIKISKTDKKNADIYIFDIQCKLGKTMFKINYLNNIYSIKNCLSGEFNVSNLVLSIFVLHKIDYGFDDILKSITSIKSLAGRFDLVYDSEDFKIIIDYAHTLESFKQIVLNTKKLSKNKLIVIFGCPGERDSTKRFLMGKFAGENCDFIIVTTDNPASENPRRIMFEIEEGIKFSKSKNIHYLIENRQKAIKKAIKIAKKQKNCNILVVGKGIENYQIVGDKKIKYCDYDAVKSVLKDLKLYNKKI